MEEIVTHNIQHEWSYLRLLKATTCHFIFEGLFLPLVYYPPVAQVVVYYPQQIVWNLLSHHHLNTVLLTRGIERIAYVNADQGAESLTLSSSSSCFSGDGHHYLDGVYCRRAIPKAELVLRETVFTNHVTLWSL